jgi:hypothetical protein
LLSFVQIQPIVLSHVGRHVVFMVRLHAGVQLLGLLLATHQSDAPRPVTGMRINAIACTAEIPENRRRRIRIQDTDPGREIRQRIEALRTLHHAYQDGGIDLPAVGRLKAWLHVITPRMDG